MRGLGVSVESELSGTRRRTRQMNGWRLDDEQASAVSVEAETSSL